MPEQRRATFLIKTARSCLPGLMDGPFVKLIPIFAIAGLSREQNKAFYVALMTSLGARKSTGLAGTRPDAGKVGEQRIRSYLLVAEL